MMNKIKYILVTILCFSFLTASYAFRNPETERNQDQQQTSYRMDCALATAEVDLDINNVRARLLVGGDVWWDGNEAGYIVPKVEAGLEGVSSIFAGSVWLGGVDPGGNLKVAAKTYGTSNGQTDFWPGPLDPSNGTVDAETCEKWDRHFEVLGSNIDEHLRNYNQFVVTDSMPYPTDLIPTDVKGWPARGNEFFFVLNDFELPNTDQGLGAFHDENGDGLYQPQFGDYPIIEIRGCPVPQYPDQMFFWIYNDAGGIHSTQGDAIQMEIQVQAFAYETNDELNDMTFMRYKLINRAVETIDSTFFAMWADGDLGCSEDDYIGCDTTRSLMYVYNQDAVDGATGDACPGGVNTYGSNVPIVGVDYFRGPLAPKLFNGQTPGPGVAPDTLVELGMTSFIYHNRGVGNPPTITLDPGNAQQYYNYLTGTWLDGSPVTFGGNGVGGNLPTKYVFPDDPDNDNGWSMCTADLPFDDRRTIQASGPFRLDPGRINELIIGVPWVPDLAYPCPDISRLQRADDLAQNLFDNCFDITDGPDAPDVCFVELDRKIIFALSNDQAVSNNAFEDYIELDVRSTAGPIPDEEKSYVFEGYKVYQFKDASVTTGEINDPERSQLVFQCDIKNGVGDIYNWSEVSNPNADINMEEPTVYVPELMVEGNDQGIMHTFEITEDKFATGDNTELVNHKKYYFLAIAYGYNNWRAFSPIEGVGQERPYLEGRKNLQTYEVIPRPIVDKRLNADYGDGAEIIRLDGQGAGGNFLDISEAERNRIFDEQEGGSASNPSDYNGQITYLPNSAPIEIKIHDPLRVVDGEYILRFEQDEKLATGEVGWALYDGSGADIIETSTETLEELNEQIMTDLGFSISVRQTEEAGDLSETENGVIGQTITYANPAINWLQPVGDDQVIPGAGGSVNFLPTSPGEIYFEEDPNQAYSSFGDGYFQPFTLCDYRIRQNDLYITPGWMNSGAEIAHIQNPLGNLPNVDIVLTSDKEKWSKCIVVETASEYYYGSQFLGLVTDGGAENFELRPARSVTRFDEDGDGLPDQVTDPNDMSMGWFPGYAIDVETGVRLNIFFGENTTYGDLTPFPNLFQDENPNGSDMMWNPTSQGALMTGTFSIYNFLAGGQHYMYVSTTPYDECAFLKEQLSQTSVLQKVKATSTIAWASVPLLNQGFRLNSYADGLIPTETTFKLRVDNPYNTDLGTNDNATYPSYKFKIAGAAAEPNVTQAEIDSQLDMINVVPNPYLAGSAYEINQFNKKVKITNLPAKCMINIYSLNGQFIRQYDRDEVEIAKSGNNPAVGSFQINPGVEWDLENDAGIPVSSGVYLIHVSAEGLGERVIKFFVVNRQFDPAGL